MYYFLLLSSGVSFYLCIPIISMFIFFDSSLWVEEMEHFIFSMLSILLLVFCWPILEMSMKIWGIVSSVIIGSFFLVSDPLILYLFLEAALVPMIVLIVGLGLQPERVSASYYLVVYTMVFSGPLLIAAVNKSYLNTKMSFILNIFFAAAFMVKTPLYSLHLWLPKAHVEAPTAGSVLLAAILLKMGGVGFIWMLNFCKGDWNFIYLALAFLGAAASAAVCSFQSDLKAFVAYSSVAHMNFSVVVLMLFCVGSDSGSSIIMLSHGLISSMMFFMAGVCFHEVGSRMVYFSQSSFVLKEAMILSIIFIMTSNLAIPPSQGLFGEISSLVVSLSKYWSFSFWAFIYFLMVAYYSLFFSLLFMSSESKMQMTSVNSLLFLVVGVSLLDFILVFLF